MTPLGERGRGSHWAMTVAWYVAGSVAGGAGLGYALGTVGSFVQGRLGLSARTAVGVLALVVALGVVLDLGAFGARLPTVRRQVNEEWLHRYRGWVYGLGFGIQLGVGFSTVVEISAVYGAFAAAFLSGSARAGFSSGWHSDWLGPVRSSRLRPCAEPMSWSASTRGSGDGTAWPAVSPSRSKRSFWQRRSLPWWRERELTSSGTLRLRHRGRSPGRLGGTDLQAAGRRPDPACREFSPAGRGRGLRQQGAGRDGKRRRVHRGHRVRTAAGRARAVLSGGACPSAGHLGARRLGVASGTPGPVRHPAVHDDRWPPLLRVPGGGNGSESQRPARRGECRASDLVDRPRRPPSGGGDPSVPPGRAAARCRYPPQSNHVTSVQLGTDLRPFQGVHDLPAHRGELVPDGVRSRVLLGLPGLVPLADELLHFLRDLEALSGQAIEVEAENLIPGTQECVLLRVSHRTRAADFLQHHDGCGQVEVIGEGVAEPPVEVQCLLREHRRTRSGSPVGHPLAQVGQPKLRGLQSLPAEVHLTAISRAEAQQAVGEGIDALFGQIRHPLDVLGRLGHLLATHLEEPTVHPDRHDPVPHRAL